MTKKADRYTVIELHNSDIFQRLIAAQSLGLCWFITRGDTENHSRLYLFFDEQGWVNYLSHMYGSVADEIRASLVLYDAEKITAENALKAIKISLSYEKENE